MVVEAGVRCQEAYVDLRFVCRGYVLARVGVRVIVPAGTPSISAIQRSPSATVSSTWRTAAGRAVKGSVPHWAVIPLPLSHSTALSRMASVAGMSSGPPLRIFMGVERSRTGFVACQTLLMRLFAAVLPPPERLDELGQVVDRLQRLPGAGGVRWTSRPGWHLTLAFMGEVEEAVVPELRVRLGRAASRTAPFSLRLHGGGHFGRRALWAGVAGDLDALRLLAERSDAAARRTGIAMEEHRRYRAHLTVGRGTGWTRGPSWRCSTGSRAAGGRWRSWCSCGRACR